MFHFLLWSRKGSITSPLTSLSGLEREQESPLSAIIFTLEMADCETWAPVLMSLILLYNVAVICFVYNSPSFSFVILSCKSCYFSSLWGLMKPLVFFINLTIMPIMFLPFRSLRSWFISCLVLKNAMQSLSMCTAVSIIVVEVNLLVIVFVKISILSFCVGLLQINPAISHVVVCAF